MATAEAELERVPTWVWWTVAGVAVGSIVGVALYSARSPGYDRMIARAGAPKAIKILGAVQRYTESRGNPKSGLGIPERFPWWAEPRNAPRNLQVAESEAAEDGYDYNVSYGESPFPRPMWTFGSGGPYGMLPSSALAPYRRTDELRRGRVTPYDVFNPWRATVFFVDYVHRLVERFFDDLPPEHRTVMDLKRGLASPKLVMDFSETQTRSKRSRANSEEAVEALGLDPSVLETPVPREWPKYRGARELVP